MNDKVTPTPVYVTRRKGRVGGALIGGLLLGPLGLVGGALLGTRSETTQEVRLPAPQWKPKPRKPLGTFGKIVLIVLFGIPAVLAVSAMIAETIEKVLQ